MNPATRELHAAIAEALARLEEARLPDDSVHKARKSLKKARAALRLLREGLDDAAFRAENAALRDAGRYLAPLRDAKAVFGALSELRRRYPEEMRRLDLQRFKDSLQGEQQRARRDILQSGAAPEKCARLLKRSLSRAEQPDFARIDSKPLDQGLQRIYRKGRRAFATARESGTDEALHEWRKQVKYLLNALEVLVPARGKRAKAAKRAEKLADRLGDEHDLVALSQRSRTLRGLQPVIERRRAKLKKRAFALGRKLYKQKAKRFVERVTSSS